MKIIQEDTKPVFDLTPHQVRMATCYRDRNGVYHLFSDYIDADMGTIDSWEAEIRYYKSDDLRNWEYVETPASRGQTGEPDSFGAASPHVLATNDKIFLFYASRQVHGDAKMNCFAKSGEPGFMSGSIMMCVADADINGAPAGPFKKHGIVLKSGTGWNSMRLDDPCALLKGDTVHLYFKGFDNNLDHDRICVGHSSVKLNDMKFISDPKPVISVPGGGEMPRLFMKEDKWNMFYRHFAGIGKPYSWHHHQSEDGISWNQNSTNFFAGRLGPSDIMLIYDMNGELPAEPQLLVAGSENGIQKLWLYKVCPNFCNDKLPDNAPLARLGSRRPLQTLAPYLQDSGFLFVLFLLCVFCFFSIVLSLSFSLILFALFVAHGVTPFYVCFVCLFLDV